MFSPRKSFFLVSGIFALWFFFVRTSSLDHPPIHKTSKRPPFPGRPHYPPFHPPPLDDHPLEQLPSSSSDPTWASRAESVKRTFIHAYSGYTQFAPFPADELLPLTNSSIINFNGWGLTMVDSLDTMLLLGLKDEFKHALSQVEQIDFAMPKHLHAPFFETVIRYLGGFLSAYALSHEPILLTRAEELATKLLPVFNTTSGLPAFSINPYTQEIRPNSGSTMLFAEIASCQMEYKYLTHLTGREDYFTKVDKVMDHMRASQPTHGMWPTVFDTKTGAPVDNHYSVGAWADSGYEYLLKQYLLSGKTEHRLAKMYMKSMRGILENLTLLSRTRNLLYITDTKEVEFVPTRKFEHLSCFFPGLLALGAATLPEAVMSARERELHMWVAEGLAHTCWVMYADQPSGLGPEVVLFDGSIHGEGYPGYPTSDYRSELWMKHLEKWEEEGRPGGKPPGVGDAGHPVDSEAGEKTDYSLWTPSYLLRPETLESMFIMYRTTRDVKWRDRGWQIWEAIESKTRTPVGYASVFGVDVVHPPREDSMPSYFLAETVKYAYLLTLDKDPWPADQYILNTEAHPLPVFTWKESERQRYGIDDVSIGS